MRGGRVIIGWTVVTYDGVDPATAKVVSVSDPFEAERAKDMERALLARNQRPELLAWKNVTRGARLEGFGEPSEEWVPPAMPEGAIH